MNLKAIGENIKRIRLDRGLTQAQLAEKADISTVHISHIETGTVAMSLDSLINISNSLDTTPNDILLGEYELHSDGASVMINQYIKNLSSKENEFIIKTAKLLEEMNIGNRNK